MQRAFLLDNSDDMCCFPLGDFPEERRIVFPSPFWFGNLEYSFLCQQYLKQFEDFSVFKSSHHTVWRIDDPLRIQRCEMKNPPSKAYWKLSTAMEKVCFISLSAFFQYMDKDDEVHLHGHEPISRNIASNSNLVKIYLTSTLMLVILIVLQILCEMIPAGLDISGWYDSGYSTSSSTCYVSHIT